MGTWPSVSSCSRSFGLELRSLFVTPPWTCRCTAAATALANARARMQVRQTACEGGVRTTCPGRTAAACWTSAAACWTGCTKRPEAPIGSKCLWCCSASCKADVRQGASGLARRRGAIAPRSGRCKPLAPTDLWWMSQLCEQGVCVERQRARVFAGRPLRRGAVCGRCGRSQAHVAAGAGEAAPGYDASFVLLRDLALDQHLEHCPGRKCSLHL